MEYREEDFLMLSGIQHFVFCRRQWALIHIEQQWKENIHTVEGNILHENAHNGMLREKRGNVIISRGMSVFSRTLGVRGICDVVEFHESEKGICLHGVKGLYDVVPVEYKKGRPKEHVADVLQLAAQAICLEEMFVCSIRKGYLYYGENRRRTEVDITHDIRDKVMQCCSEMHSLYDRRHTPKVKTGKTCSACSVKDLCLPKLCRNKSVSSYIEKMTKEGE